MLFFFSRTQLRSAVSGRSATRRRLFEVVAVVLDVPERKALQASRSEVKVDRPDHGDEQRKRNRTGEEAYVWYFYKILNFLTFD